MSTKKSLILPAVIIAAVTLISIFTGRGAAMDIKMDRENISFSGIGEFEFSLAYSDIESLSLNTDADWSAFESEGTRYIAFISDSSKIYADTNCSYALVAQLKDGSSCIFNYNNEGNTSGLYEMLLENIK